MWDLEKAKEITINKRRRKSFLGRLYFLLFVLLVLFRLWIEWWLLVELITSPHTPYILWGWRCYELVTCLFRAVAGSSSRSGHDAPWWLYGSCPAPFFALFLPWLIHIIYMGERKNCPGSQNELLAIICWKTRVKYAHMTVKLCLFQWGVSPDHVKEHINLALPCSMGIWAICCPPPFQVTLLPGPPLLLHRQWIHSPKLTHPGGVTVAHMEPHTCLHPHGSLRPATFAEELQHRQSSPSFMNHVESENVRPQEGGLKLDSRQDIGTYHDLGWEGNHCYHLQGYEGQLTERGVLQVHQSPESGSEAPVGMVADLQ